MGSRHPGRAASAALQGLRAHFARGDVVFANLEGNLLPASMPGSRVMRADPSVASVLKDAGITVVNVANNHSMEFGAEGFAATLEALRAAGLAIVGVRGTDGWGCEPVVFRDLHGRSLGMLGYSRRPGQFSGDREPAHAMVPGPVILDDVRRLRAACDDVIVSLHWGEDHVAETSAAERDFALELLSAGATAVLGHHPQVARPVELVGSKAIAYSLGTLVGDHTWLPRTRRGLILELEIGAQGVASAVVSSTRLGADLVTRPDQTPAVVVTTPIDVVSDAGYAKAVRRASLVRRLCGGAHVLRNFHRYEPSFRRNIGRKLLSALGRS